MSVFTLVIIGPGLSISYKDSFPFSRNWTSTSETGIVTHVDLIHIPVGKSGFVYRYVFTLHNEDNFNTKPFEGVSYSKCSRRNVDPRYKVGEKVSLESYKTNDNSVYYKIKGCLCDNISGKYSFLIYVFLFGFTLILFFVLSVAFKTPYLGYKRNKRYDYKRRYACVLSVWGFLILHLCLIVFLLFSQPGLFKDSFLFNAKWINGGHGKIVRIEPKGQTVKYQFEWHDESSENYGKLQGISYSSGEDPSLYNLNDDADILIFNNDRFSGCKLVNTFCTDPKPYLRTIVYMAVFVFPLIILFALFMLINPYRKLRDEEMRP